MPPAPPSAYGLPSPAEASALVSHGLHCNFLLHPVKVSASQPLPFPAHYTSIVSYRLPLSALSVHVADSCKSDIHRVQEPPHRASATRPVPAASSVPFPKPVSILLPHQQKPPQAHTSLHTISADPSTSGVQPARYGNWRPAPPYAFPLPPAFRRTADVRQKPLPD